MTDLRVAYDDDIYDKLDLLADTDPIELRDTAFNLVRDVETLKAALAEAEARGHAKAVAQLRALAEENGEEAAYWRRKADDGFAAPEELRRRAGHAERAMSEAAAVTAHADYLEAQGAKP